MWPRCPLTLNRNVCLCLGAMARNSVDLAELAVEAEIFPKILLLLRDPAEGPRAPLGVEGTTQSFAQ